MGYKVYLLMDIDKLIYIHILEPWNIEKYVKYYQSKR